MVSTPAPTRIDPGDYVPTADERVVLRGLGCDGFESLLRLRGERSRPRMAYLDGAVELLMPSKGHERTKSMLGSLLEQYCLERDILLTPNGEWLLTRQEQEAGAEPDECYLFGPDPDTNAQPDLVIEVEWTRGGLDKLEIYRRLNIDEVWVWKRDAIEVHGLEYGSYVRRPSRWIPGLDLALLCELAHVTPLNEAVKQLRERLRSR